jgi:4-amino-4-deoxy-L-arabinose transferase-like glycosyltransferase
MHARRRLLACVAAGLALRLALAIFAPRDTPDGDGYARLGHNLLRHGTLSDDERPPFRPTMIRTPGYPLLLAAIYAVRDSPTAVRVTQAVLDCATIGAAFVLADGVAPPLLAALLVALCLFTAASVSFLMTEALTTVLAVAALCALRRAQQGRACISILGAGVAQGLLVMVRPDFALLPAASALWLGWFLRRRRAVAVALLLAGVALPIAPWAARNALRFGVLQPLTPTFAVDGVQPDGYYAWLRTWHTRPADNLRAVWPYLGRDPAHVSIPDDAFDDAAERARVAELLVLAGGDDDSRRRAEAGFAELGRERTRRHPLRTFVLLPLLRASRLWLASRSASLPLPPPGVRARSQQLVLGALNLSLLAAALVGAWAIRRDRRLLALLLLLPLYRTALFAFFPGCEPRYVIQAYPPLLVLAAAGIARLADQRRPTTAS